MDFFSQYKDVDNSEKVTDKTERENNNDEFIHINNKDIENSNNEEISNEEISNEEVGNEEVGNEEMNNEEVGNEEVSNKEMKNEENDINNNTISMVDFNNDETGGIIYDILHFFDDIYVYGRTLLENNYINLADTDDFNLVYPNIYIGNYSTSTNYELLKTLGITHIISAIPSFNPPFEDKFNYLHIEAYDDESQDISQYFEISNEFINECLNQGGKILIHCMVGRSRSVCLFLGFLIYIMQGRFHKKSLNLENNNDIYNSIEYNKFIKDNKKNYSYDGMNYGNSRNGNSRNGNSNNDNYNGDNYNGDYDKINKNNEIKPQFNDKEKSFILYKKEKMLLDVDELINSYETLKKEITIYKKDSNNNMSINFEKTKNYKDVNELNQIVKNMKLQAGQYFISSLLTYVKKYRRESNPNPYFIKQIIEYSFY
jgi:hypothetical protein